MPRWQASVELLTKEFTRDIEGKDFIEDSMQGGINAARTLIQGVLEIGPAAWHTIIGLLGNEQKFMVQKREGLVDGMQQAASNTITELRNGKFLSAIYTLLSEIFPDSVVRDAVQGHTIKAV